METIKTIIEPFRIKVVEPIPFTTRAKRAEMLEEAGYNLFQIDAQNVTIDMLTDSGTSALSSRQWSALMLGDESYAGASSFHHFKNTVKNIFGFSQVLPVHQGRAAERILFSELVKPGNIVPGNAHFDTTRANIELRGAKAIDLPCKARVEASDEDFLGNIDLEQLEDLIQTTGADNIPLVIMTITSNTCAGQPVSMHNIAAVSKLLKKYDIPLYIDAARFAENAYFVKNYEQGYKERTILSIAQEMFSYAQGAMMSCKKDGLANIGGFIALNDRDLAERLKVNLIVSEGFPTYGGLTGRDLETIAVGLTEVLEDDYLNYRAASARFLWRGLNRLSVPLIQKPALHAVYVDAAAMLPHIEPEQLPGQVLASELFLEGGIRTCEIGTAMFGKTNEKTGKQICAKRELVRLALPRRVYTQSHFEYVIEAFANIQERKDKLSGFSIAHEAPVLRHFTAVFSKVLKTSQSPVML
ncbi:MAG: tryptophanase [Candidatus Melainabacteria bacterium]|nr:tryptophanase [Candidatus Melainabacteria bacterium]